MKPLVAKMRQDSGQLAEQWYAAARSEEVTTKQPHGCVVLGEMLVLWRSSTGEAICMLDRCLHRNALLSEGALFDDCLGCPYHGWTYAADGRLVNVPSEGPEAASRVERRLPTFAVLERDGLVWVWMGVTTRPEDRPERQPFSMPHHSQAGYGSYYMVTNFENNVTNLVENFMDVPHTVFVHRGWFRSRRQKPIRTVVERTSSSVLVTYDQPNDSIGFTERILNPRRLPMVHTDKFFLPNTTRVDYVFGDNDRAFVITSTCTPVAPFKTRVYTLISYKLGWFNHVARFFLPAYTRKVIDQDVEIMEIQGRGLQHYAREDFCSTDADKLHLHIEALRDWAARDSNEPAPAPVREEMTFWV